MSCVCTQSLQSYLTFVTLWTIVHQGSLSMGFSRPEHWSGLPCSPPGNLPHPGTEHASPVSPALQMASLPQSHQGSPIRACCWCSVTKSCLELCDPMDYSMAVFLVLHYLPEFAQIHVHWVSDTIQLSHPLWLLFLLPLVFPSIWSFPVSQAFASDGQNIGALVSASVLLMNIQDWFPLGLTSLISLQFKGLSSIFASTTVWATEN